MALALAGAVPWSAVAVALNSPPVKHALSQLATLAATAVHHVPTIGDQTDGFGSGIPEATVAIAVATLVLLCLAWTLGATNGACTMWVWQRRQQLLTLCIGVPSNGPDIVSRWRRNRDDLARYLTAGGNAAFVDAADRPDTTVDAVRQWYVEC